MLSGTSVSFITEQGLAIDTSNVTVDESGTATVVAYTQHPVDSFSACENVAEQAWETQLISHIESTYSKTLPGNPRDGLCSIMVYVEGEEHFYDANANGVYDAGEGFVDTDADPFIDYNDDDRRDDGMDPFENYLFEEYIDSGTQNGVWDGENGVWDSTKNIFTNFNILLTGKPHLIKSSKPEIDLENGEHAYFTVIVCDQNGNRLNGGSTVKVELQGAGELSGFTEYEFVDTNQPGYPLEMSFKIEDADLEDEDPEEYFQVVVTVNWSGEYSSIEYVAVVTDGYID